MRKHSPLTVNRSITELFSKNSSPNVVIFKHEKITPALLLAEWDIMEANSNDIKGFIKYWSPPPEIIHKPFKRFRIVQDNESKELRCVSYKGCYYFHHYTIIENANVQDAIEFMLRKGFTQFF